MIPFLATFNPPNQQSDSPVSLASTLISRHEGPYDAIFPNVSPIPKSVLDIFPQPDMMWLAAQDEKNAPRYSQVGFPGQLILTASHRHSAFWRLSDSPYRACPCTSKDTAREPEVEFASGARPGKNATRASAPEFTSCAQTRGATTRGAEPEFASRSRTKKGSTRGAKPEFASRGRCGCDQEYTSEA